MRCNSCGAEVPAEARFCPYCGQQPQPAVAAPAAMPSTPPVATAAPVAPAAPVVAAAPFAPPGAPVATAPFGSTGHAAPYGTETATATAPYAPGAASATATYAPPAASAAGAGAGGWSPPAGGWAPPGGAGGRGYGAGAYRGASSSSPLSGTAALLIIGFVWYLLTRLFLMFGFGPLNSAFGLIYSGVFNILSLILLLLAPVPLLIAGIRLAMHAASTGKGSGASSWTGLAAVAMFAVMLLFVVQELSLQYGYIGLQYNIYVLGISAAEAASISGVYIYVTIALLLVCLLLFIVLAIHSNSTASASGLFIPPIMLLGIMVLFWVYSTFIFPMLVQAALNGWGTLEIISWISIIGGSLGILLYTVFYALQARILLQVK